MLLEILQNSHESNCARVSFWINLQTGGLQLYWKRNPTAVAFLWILQFFSEQPFCKTSAFDCKAKLMQKLYVHNRKQHFKKNFYVLTHMHLSRTSRSSFSYLSTNKSSVSLLQGFSGSLAGGKVGALNKLIQKTFCYSFIKIVIFWSSHFHLPLFLRLQFCKISNCYSFWYLNYAVSSFAINYTPWSFLLLPIISFSGLCALVHYFSAKRNRLLYQYSPGSTWTISWMFANILRIFANISWIRLEHSLKFSSTFLRILKWYHSLESSKRFSGVLVNIPRVSSIPRILLPVPVFLVL